jgi:hypothetical protein
MLSEEKIKKMIRLSDYETGQGRIDLKRVRYLKMDYVRLQVLKTIVSVLLAFLLILGIITIYNIDYVLQNALALPLHAVALYGGAGVVMVCIVSIIVTCRMASRGYEESRVRAEEYESTLRELMEIYVKEDQGEIHS